MEILCSCGSRTFQSLNFPYSTKRIPSGSCGLLQMVERSGQFLFCLRRRCFDSFGWRRKHQVSPIYSNDAYCCADLWWYHKGCKQFYRGLKMYILDMFCSYLLVLGCRSPLHTTRNVRFPRLGVCQHRTCVVHLTVLEHISHLVQEYIHRRHQAQFQWTKVA